MGNKFTRFRIVTIINPAGRYHENSKRIGRHSIRDRLRLYSLLSADRLTNDRRIQTGCSTQRQYGANVPCRKCNFANIQVGDTITFRAGTDGMVTHRVTSKSELSRTFTTKGDANPSEDPSPVEYSNVIGKVLKFSVPYAGYFVAYSKNFTVIGMMAGIIILNIILDSLFPKKKKEEERTENKNEEKLS